MFRHGKGGVIEIQTLKACPEPVEGFPLRGDARFKQSVHTLICFLFIGKTFGVYFSETLPKVLGKVPPDAVNVGSAVTRVIVLH